MATQGHGPPRAFRGLALVFLLSLLNVVGLSLTAAGLGGLEPWSRWQFIGAFGVLEAAAGLANVLSPNLWRLPIAQLQTGGKTDVRLAASTAFIPHWGGLARCAAGAVCMGIAAWRVGLGPASAALVPLVLALALSILAVSAAVARAGVARPDLDVVQLVVRWRARENELQPISIGASTLQFLITVVTLPAVKVLSPSVLYRPELGPSPSTLLVGIGLAAALLVLVGVLWAGRMDVKAPREQQREAEEHA